MFSDQGLLFVLTLALRVMSVIREFNVVELRLAATFRKKDHKCFQLHLLKGNSLIISDYVRI